jgi:hypothetical protein
MIRSDGNRRSKEEEEKEDEGNSQGEGKVISENYVGDNRKGKL